MIVFENGSRVEYRQVGLFKEVQFNGFVLEGYKTVFIGQLGAEAKDRLKIKASEVSIVAEVKADNNTANIISEMMEAKEINHATKTGLFVHCDVKIMVPVSFKPGKEIKINEVIAVETTADGKTYVRPCKKSSAMFYLDIKTWTLKEGTSRLSILGSLYDGPAVSEVSDKGKALLDRCAASAVEVSAKKKEFFAGQAESRRRRTTATDTATEIKGQDTTSNRRRR